MLEEVRIRGLGVIEDAVLSLVPGLTVLTGETGAGKTMVVTGLGLLLGGRADAGSVRPGAGQAVVEGRVQVSVGGAVESRAAEAGGAVESRAADAGGAVESGGDLEAGGDLDAGVLLITRTVSAEGRSRAHVGGRAVPVGLLAELAEHLVAVHGQADQQRLVRPALQRELLDRYAGEGFAATLERYRQAWGRHRDAGEELDVLVRAARERAQELDLLRLGLAEIESVDPQPGEEATLREDIARLGHADALRTAAAAAHEALVADPYASGAEGRGADATTLIGAARQLVGAQSRHDPALAALHERLVELETLGADVAGDLASYADGVDTDPGRLATAQERLAALSALTRKYGEDVGEVLEWADHAGRRVLELDGADDRIAALRAERAELARRLGALAAELTATRSEAAARLAAETTGELAALALPRARFEVTVCQREDPEGLAVGGRTLALGPHGADDVELQLAAHAGAPLRPLARGASGGELSRVMLALEVALAGVDPVPTFVFDEVDAGVGGAAAVEVGRRLARLARSSQVLVVTHLPQVAAFADQHLLVEKSEDGAVTRSGVTSLDHTARVRELSRMLAGLTGSQTALAHAEELLATAREDRAAGRA